MTRKARALGMSRTVYRNASGLPDDEQVTTARDQTRLAIAIQERFPRFYRYFSIVNFTYRGETMRNHNKLLGRVAGVDGIRLYMQPVQDLTIEDRISRTQYQFSVEDAIKALITRSANDAAVVVA